MIPLAIPNLAGREGEYLQECVSSNLVSTVGPFVGMFEALVASASESDFCVAMSSGTSALHAGLIALGVKPGDLVICPALTFIASANAISHCGATPWLMDVSQESWTVDPTILNEALTNDTEMTEGGLIHVATGRRVSAILPVFTLGCPADMDPINQIANDFGLKVIVDGAAALGAEYKNRKLGKIGADLLMYSFNGNKTVTAGGGGSLISADESLMKLVRHLTTTARSSSDYDHDMVGYNYRMTNIQAAVGCAQMENLDLFVGIKRRISALYNLELVNQDIVQAFPEPDWAKSACWFSGVYLPGVPANQIVKIRAKMQLEGIDARPFWKPMYLQKPYQNAPRTSMGVTDAIWQHVLTLPCFTQLKEDEQGFVIEQFRKAICG